MRRDYTAATAQLAQEYAQHLPLRRSEQLLLHRNDNRAISDLLGALLDGGSVFGDAASVVRDSPWQTQRSCPERRVYPGSALDLRILHAKLPIELTSGTCHPTSNRSP